MSIVALTNRSQKERFELDRISYDFSFDVYYTKNEKQTNTDMNIFKHRSIFESSFQSETHDKEICSNFTGEFE